MRAVPDLAKSKADYIAKVRAQVLEARGRASTPGKEATYAAKLAEAQAVVENRSGTWPYVEAEARRRGCSLVEAAKAIIAAAGRVALVLFQLDELELDTVAKIKSSGNLAEAYAAVRQFEAHINIL